MLEVFVVILDPYTSEPQSNVAVEARKQSDGTIIALETTNIHGVATFTALSDDATFHARTSNVPPLYQVTQGGREGLVNVDYVVDSNGRGTHLLLFGASGALEAAIATGGDRVIWICSGHSESIATTHALTNLADGQEITVMSAGINRPTFTVAAGLGADALINHGTASSGGSDGSKLRFQGVSFTRPSAATGGPWFTGTGGFILPDIELIDVTFSGSSGKWTAIFNFRGTGSANVEDILLERVMSDVNIGALVTISTALGSIGKFVVSNCDFASLDYLQRRVDSTDVDVGVDGILITNNLFRIITTYAWSRTYTLDNWPFVFTGNIILDFQAAAPCLQIGTPGTTSPTNATIDGNFIRCSNDHADTRAVKVTGGAGTAKNISIVGNSLQGPGGAEAHIAVDFDIANEDCVVLNACRDWDNCTTGYATSGPPVGDFRWGADTELTISSGAITVTQSHHTIDTEGDAATDDLDTINGLVANQLYFFYPAHDARTVVFKHGTGNIECIGNDDIALDDAHDFVWAFSPDGSNVYVGGAHSSTEIIDTDRDTHWRVGSDNILRATISSTEHFRVGGTSQLDFFNGSILETTRMVVSSNGTTVTLALDQAGGGDLTLVFSDGFSTFDTTPAVTVSLTAGSDTSPQTNYVYILQSNKTLTVSTSGWPSEEHAPIAIVILQSAATTQTENALVVHVWHDHVQGSDEQGHYSHLGRWIRQHSATYESGVAQTLTITTNAGAPDNVDFATTAGEVYQMHLHTVPAFDTATGTNVHVVNDSVSPYTPVTDLADLLTDSAGGSMSGKYFNLVIWASVSEETDETHLFINLPSGSYNKLGDAIDDVSGFTDFTIPDDFKGTAFLISRLTLRHQAASGGTWTSEQETDLRGLIPNLVAGGGTSAITTEFADNAFKLFDESDVTKLLEFQLSGIASGNTRTLTAPDASGIIALTSQPDGTIDHGADLAGLGGDDHAQYALLAGRSGGQTLQGGIASGEDLTLVSTAHATKGSVFLGSSSKFELDETTGQLKLPTAGSGGGILVGDVQLYQDGSGEWRTPDSLFVEGHMAIGADAALQADEVLRLREDRTDPAGSLLGFDLRTASVITHTSSVTRSHVGTLLGSIIQVVSGETLSGTQTGLQSGFGLSAPGGGTGTFVDVVAWSPYFVGISAPIITTLTDIRIFDPTGSLGAITTQYGIDIGALTAAATNIGIRNLSESRFVGNVKLGADSSPAAPLDVAGNILVSGTVDGVDIAARDHAEAHAPESHTGQGATAAELETLTDTSDADALHAHTNHGVTHNAVHGIAAHTEHANWKVLYTDGSGDEQELALGADATVLVAAGVSAAPVFEEIFTIHIAEFPALAENLVIGVMGGRPGKCVGESGEHGAFTAIRAKAIAGTAGTGTTTILIEADDNPAFSSPSVLYTLALDTSTEVDDTVLDNSWVGDNIFIRARCSAVGGTAPKDVNVFFYFKERAEAF